MDRVCREGDGLFPSPGEIKLSCSCPDWADMCKHVAAALYGIGARLDEKPHLLFILRGVDENELIANAGRSSAIESNAACCESARPRRCRCPVRARDGRDCPVSIPLPRPRGPGGLIIRWAGACQLKPMAGKMSYDPCGKAAARQAHRRANASLDGVSPVQARKRCSQRQRAASTGQ